jgi:hypothetical protein
MTMRSAGLALTLAAVLVLVGSMVAGLRPQPTATPWPSASIPAGSGPEPERIRVEVLNGAGVAGLARDVTERLRRDGFDVVYYGNAGRLARDSTTVLDRIGNPVASSRVAAALGIELIEVAIDTTLYLEATVILAPDFVED